LAVSVLLAKLPHLGTQSAEELFLICHALICRVVRAFSPRAD
jgi:hypothetical protein